MDIINKHVIDSNLVPSEMTIIKSPSLIDAILERNINEMKIYLNHNPESIDMLYEQIEKSDSNEWKLDIHQYDVITPLLLAVKMGSLAMVSVLVTEYHANVNIHIAGEQQTALHIACNGNHIAIVSLLLNTGNVDITISDEVI